jgi:hypothetical protein
MGEEKGGPKDGKVQGWQVGGMCQSSITRNLAKNVFRERTVPWGGREWWVWTKKVFDQCQTSDKLGVLWSRPCRHGDAEHW